jgi:hypothetical protein
MALIFPGQRLVGRMQSDALRTLGAELRDLVTELEQEAAPRLRALAVWWKWYEAVPRSQEKNFPFVGAANVVVPLIGITCDALTSRSLAQATAAAPSYWSARSENELRARVARNMARYINWQADGNDFSLKHVLADMLLETYVTGRGVCALHYRRDVRPMFFGRTPPGGTPRISRAPVTFHRGPLVEHVPQEHVFWDLRHRIGDAPVVVRKHEWSWVHLRDMAKLDEAWDRQAIEDIKKFPGVGGDEAANVEHAKATLDLRQEDVLSKELHDIREVWVNWSMLGNRFEVPSEEEWGGEQVPLLAHLHMQTGRVLRLVGMPYLLPYKPFVDFKFRGGRGVAKRLEMLQSIQTTIWNQSLDARTRANAVWAVTRNARHLKTPLDPSRPILVDAMDELEPFALPSAVQQDLPLLVAAQTMAERWMGHSDPLLGRETRSGGHPAPATSTLALLEQVNLMSAGTDVILQEELSRLGEAIAVLDQQFETNEGGKLQRVLGPVDAQSVSEYLFPEEPIPGNYFFDVVALSRTENPDAQMRRTLMTAQAYQNYGTLAAQAAMVLDSPQAGPRLKAVWAKLLDAYGDLLERFLDASNVDDGEKYLVQLEQLMVDPRNAFAQFTREAAGAAGAVQAAAAAQGGGAAAGGGGGVLTAAGSLVSAGNSAARGTAGPPAGGSVL